MPVVMPASDEASAVDHTAGLVERERIGIAVLLQLQFGRADHFLHEPQCSADVHNFQHETLFESRQLVFLEGGRAPRRTTTDHLSPRTKYTGCLTSDARMMGSSERQS